MSLKLSGAEPPNHRLWLTQRHTCARCMCSLHLTLTVCPTYTLSHSHRTCPGSYSQCHLLLTGFTCCGSDLGARIQCLVALHGTIAILPFKRAFGQKSYTAMDALWALGHSNSKRRQPMWPQQLQADHLWCVQQASGEMTPKLYRKPISWWQEP